MYEVDYKLHSLAYFCLSSSAGSVGTSVASQSSRLNNAFYVFSLYFDFVGLSLYHLRPCCFEHLLLLFVLQCIPHSTA